MKSKFIECFLLLFNKVLMNRSDLKEKYLLSKESYEQLDEKGLREKLKDLLGWIYLEDLQSVYEQGVFNNIHTLTVVVEMITKYGRRQNPHVVKILQEYERYKDEQLIQSCLKEEKTAAEASGSSGTATKRVRRSSPTQLEKGGESNKIKRLEDELSTQKKENEQLTQKINQLQQERIAIKKVVEKINSANDSLKTLLEMD